MSGERVIIEEVVTKALLREVAHPTGVRIALITLDNGRDHTRPNTLGPQGLEQLDRAIDQALESPADAVAIVGKPFIFAAGADLSVIGSISSAADAAEAGRQGHSVFARLGEAGRPTFAFVNGVALGGGLELALHCNYRTVSSGSGAIGLPECFLGLLPGWGGTYLLPNIAGPEVAVKVIIENALSGNRLLKGREALGLGLADAMFEPAEFVEESLGFAADVVTGKRQVTRLVPDRGEPWAAAVARGVAFADSKVHGAAPAPYKALELIQLASTASRQEAFASEERLLSELIMSEELRSGLYSFDLVQRRARHPAGAPAAGLERPVGKVGVVGAGLMASQLALLFLRRLDVPVVMTDIVPARLDGAVAYVRSELSKLHARGRLSDGAEAKLSQMVSGSRSLDAFADADLVIEAVFEELDVKRQVFSEVEKVVGDECILATNTSSLSVGAMGTTLANPGRLVGLHFFNPVAVLPLVEVVRAGGTDDATVATAAWVVAKLKKSAVLVRDAPAFVVNRLLTRLLSEVTRAIDDGMPLQEADGAFAPLGLPMTPLTLLGLVGPAVALHVAESLAAWAPERFYVSPNLRALVRAGKAGVYLPGTTEVDSEVAAMFASRAGSGAAGDRGPGEGGQALGGDGAGSSLLTRALAALAEEARLMLDEGVVAEAQDIDLCMLLGAGWPFHMGGLTPYLDRAGISERVTGRRFLDRGVASLPE
ncbi:MAG: 3-hydroxyacyl-CoA dehydrogenase NAD-binding domain-containing protein [Acidimicrobiales bacterium]